MDDICYTIIGIAMIKVMIADDHILIREGLKKILDREMDLEVVAEAQNAEEIFDHLKDNLCDVVILDISLPDKNGLDVLKDIRAMYPKVNVLIQSMHPEDRFAIRALKAGALGYITKESAPSELVKAIRKVINGRKYVSEQLAEQLAFSVGSNTNKPNHEKLSDREFQVFCMIGEGKTVQDISKTLSLSVSTINTYRVRIMEKMNMSSNLEIIHYSVQNKLVD